jgi:hypothetical protein
VSVRTSFSRKLAVSLFRDSETNIGGTVVGGLEYFTSRTTVIKGEAQYYCIDQGNLPQSPSAFALMIGVKKYF